MPATLHSAFCNLNFELGLCPKVCSLDSQVFGQRPALAGQRNPADFEDVGPVADLKRHPCVRGSDQAVRGWLETKS